MKRVLCGALAVILAIGCLTGCQEGNDLNSTNESSQAVHLNLIRRTKRKV